MFNQEICSSIAQSVEGFQEIVSLENDSAAKALDILSRDIIVSDGVRITKKDEEPIVDIYVVVEFGTQIPKLAWELQKKVESDIKKLTGQDVKEINVHIEGVGTKERIK